MHNSTSTHAQMVKAECFGGIMHNSTGTHAQMVKREHVWADPWSPKLMSRAYYCAIDNASKLRNSLI